MNQTIENILQKWFSYMNRNNFYFYTEIQSAQNLLQNYDVNGLFTSVYARGRFEMFLNSQKVSLLKLLTDPEYIAEEKELYELLHSDIVNRAEDSILESMSTILLAISGKTEIGERDKKAERESLQRCIENTTESLRSLHLDVYRKGGRVGTITSFPTQVFLYNTLAECVMDMERAPDSLHICYIRNNDTADGYFGYFIKSNGNIFSVHERIDECFQGEHAGHRNGRWMENKAEGIFPYSIFDFSERDYKGYAHRFEIEKEKLQFQNMEEGDYFPMVLAIALLMQKYTGASLENEEIVYSNMMFPVNQPLLTGESSKALALVEKSEYALSTVQALQGITMTTDMVMKGEWDREAKLSSVIMSEQTPGSYIQKLIDRYGKGFGLDKSSMMKQETITQNRLLSTTGGEITTIPEFVGNPKRLEMEMYRQGRQQLADYIQENMFREYRASGGYWPTVNRYYEALKKHWSEIEDYCVFIWKNQMEQMETKKDADENESAPERVYNDSIIPCYIYLNTKRKVPYDVCGLYFVNGEKRAAYDDTVLCPVTGKNASVYFLFKPQTAEDLHKLLGNDVPEMLQMWHTGARGDFALPNPILNATDPVAFLKSPFDAAHELDSRRELYNKYKAIDKEISQTGKWSGTASFFPGFSKNVLFACAWSTNGWKHVLKKH